MRGLIFFLVGKKTNGITDAPVIQLSRTIIIPPCVTNEIGNESLNCDMQEDKNKNDQEGIL